MRPEVFIKAVSYRLGLTQYHYNPGDPCKMCGHREDEAGFHAVHCANSKVLVRRHHRLVRALQDAGTGMDLAVHLEDSILEDGRDRAGDISVVFGDVRHYSDVTVINPAAPIYASRAKSRLWAAKYAAKKKIDKYADRIQLRADAGEKVAFVPLAVETYGGWCPQAIAFLKLFATFMTNRPGALFHSPGESLRNLLATLDVINQSENARAILLRDRVALPILA